MKTVIVAAAGMAAAITAMACNVTGLANSPRATFAQLACLDVNGDHLLDGQDAADPAKVPDFNADGKHAADDAAFLQGLSIRLAPEPCPKDPGRAPEYAVTHGYFESSNVTCDGGKRPVLLIGIGGGVVNIKDREDAAGVRSIIDGIQKAYDDKGVDTIAVLAGPAIVGAGNIHSAMEQWLTHAARVYLDRYPCLRLLLVGHSHGAVTADVVGGNLEGRYGERIIEVVDVDRVTPLYLGDTTTRPTQAHVFNVFESGSGILRGASYDRANAENWDATAELAPKDGDNGGPLQPVNHTTIDNSKSVKQRIIDQVLARSA